MDYFRNYYGNPGQFGNWQQYAGMSPSGTFQGDAAMAKQPAAGGVAPPATFAEMGQQAIKGVSDKISAVGTNLSNAASQFGQGNVLQGARAMSGAVPPGAPKPPAAPTVGGPAVVDDYDYTSMVGR